MPPRSRRRASAANGDGQAHGNGSAAAAKAAATGDVAVATAAAPAPALADARSLVCELCAAFYRLGWVSGTGGGLSIKVGDRIVMAPSGVQKERMAPDDLFILDGSSGEVLHTPAPKPPPARPPKLSECAPLFMAAYELRGAGAVIHSHSLSAVLATVLAGEGAPEFRVTHLEMIKGIAGHGCFEELVVPIIENTAREAELTDRLRAAIAAYPRSSAVLVRRHGVYVWGKDWIQAKAQAESYDYLFEAAVRMKSGLGIRADVAPVRAGGCGSGDEPAAKKARAETQAGSQAPAPPSTTSVRAVVLDIEGTVAPISYVTRTLFPYAAAHVGAYLGAGEGGEAAYARPAVQAHLAALRAQAATDTAAGLSVPPIPPPEAGREAVLAGALANIKAQMDADRKTTALKALQGDVWAGGFAAGELVADFFPDVAPALARWAGAGMKTYIFSSGSRRAQRDLFAHTPAGDLRPHLCGFFDTTSGAKGERAAYENIGAALGLDSPDQALFATDVLAEARAAAEAGWRVALVVRPGNAPLPDGHGFRVVDSMDGLVEGA
jgi:methylthioribulose 1-phosphate dehydratase / enolase-phosphatase E1